MALASEVNRQTGHVENVEAGWQEFKMEIGEQVVQEDGVTPAIYVEENDYVYHSSHDEYEEVITPVYQIRTHTGKRPFVCHGCNMMVTPNSRRLSHIRNLGGGRPIVRHVYYMNFTRRSLSPPKESPEKGKKLGKGKKYPWSLGPPKDTLEKGKKLGKGKKTYPCDKCERIFGHKSHLDNHHRVHSGEKPFFCIRCDKRFGQKSNLTAHLKRHRAESDAGTTSFKKKPKGMMKKVKLENKDDPEENSTLQSVEEEAGGSSWIGAQNEEDEDEVPKSHSSSLDALSKKREEMEEEEEPPKSHSSSLDPLAKKEEVDDEEEEEEEEEEGHLRAHSSSPDAVAEKKKKKKETSAQVAVGGQDERRSPELSLGVTSDNGVPSWESEQRGEASSPEIIVKREIPSPKPPEDSPWPSSSSLSENPSNHSLKEEV